MKSSPTAELVIVGKKYLQFAQELMAKFISNRIVLAMENKSDLPLFINRESRNEETMIYVCFNKSCKLPVSSVEEAIKQLEN